MEESTREEIRKITAKTLRDADLTEPPLQIEVLLLQSFESEGQRIVGIGESEVGFELLESVGGFHGLSRITHSGSR